jgi:hypothetical protein
MARLLGPDGPTRIALRFERASRQVSGLAGKTLTVYSDQACTTLADVLAYQPGSPAVPGAAIAGSVIRAGVDSVLPLFWFPDGEVDTVWARTHDGQVLTLVADVDRRLDGLSSAGRLNVRSFGAAGDGQTNDTAAIQAAINAVPTAGGAVYFPTGQYRVNAPLVLRSNLVLTGDGDGPSLIQQVGADQDLLTGTALNKIVIEKLYLVGTGAGTGSGVNLAKGGNDAVPYVSMRDVTVESFGLDGIAVENPIVSSFDRVITQTCGRYGINLFGQAGGAAGTSSALAACYGNGCGTAGIRLLNVVYATVLGCAADHNPIGYLIDGCQGVNVNGSGAEGNTTAGVRVNGGYGVSLIGVWEYDNRGIGVHITGSANTVTVIGATDNTPNASATHFLQVDSGSHVLLANCNNTSSNQLASGTTNVAADAAGGGQVQGYLAILAGGECDGDMTFWNTAKGPVLIDRVTSAAYRLKASNGVLGIEAV